MNRKTVSDGALRVLETYQMAAFALVEVTYDTETQYIDCNVAMKNILLEDEAVRRELVHLSDSDFVNGPGAYTFILWCAQRGSYDDPFYVVLKQEIVRYEPEAEAQP